MDLSKYEAASAEPPLDLPQRYHRLRELLNQLHAAPTQDLRAILALQDELDEVQAALKDLNKREGDPQRF